MGNNLLCCEVRSEENKDIPEDRTELTRKNVKVKTLN